MPRSCATCAGPCSITFMRACGGMVLLQYACSWLAVMSGFLTCKHRSPVLNSRCIVSASFTTAPGDVMTMT